MASQTEMFICHVFPSPPQPLLVTRLGLDKGAGEAPVPLSDCSFSLNTRERIVIIPSF